MHRLEEIKPRPEPNDNPEPYQRPPRPQLPTTPEMTGSAPARGLPGGPEASHFDRGAIPGESLKNNTSGTKRDLGGGYVPQPGKRPGERR